MDTFAFRSARRRRWGVGSGVLLWLMSASLAGAETSPGTVVVTWSDIVRLVDAHPRLAAGQAQIAAARGAVRAAGEAPNPTLEARLGQGRAQQGPESRLEWGLSLTVPLGWIAQRRSRVEAAEAEVDVATAEAKAIRRDALVQLGTLYWTLAYDQVRVAALDELRAQTSELARAVRLRVQKGEARPIEAPRMEVELEKVTGELEAARTSLSARQTQLGLWLHVGPGRRIRVAAELDTPPATTTPETVRA